MTITGSVIPICYKNSRAQIWEILFPSLRSLSTIVENNESSLRCTPVSLYDMSYDCNAVDPVLVDIALCCHFVAEKLDFPGLGGVFAVLTGEKYVVACIRKDQAFII